MFDTIIIGSGPAGIGTAIYLKRANINVLVLTTHTSTLNKVDKIENYYGFDSINGIDLYNKGIEQAKKLEIPIYNEEVTSISKSNLFEVKTNQNAYQAKTVVIATGISRNTIKINNIDQFEGKGVSYCATCDGFFYKNKNIAVIGEGDYAKEEIKHLLNITKKITVLTNGSKPNQSLVELNLPIIEQPIKEIVGKELVEQIRLENDQMINIEGIFIALGVADSTSFAKTLGLRLNKNYLAVNERYETGIEGLYAVGDCIGGLLQISKAISDGANASTHIIKKVKEKVN